MCVCVCRVCTLESVNTVFTRLQFHSVVFYQISLFPRSPCARARVFVCDDHKSFHRKNCQLMLTAHRHTVYTEAVSAAITYSETHRYNEFFSCEKIASQLIDLVCATTHIN